MSSMLDKVIKSLGSVLGFIDPKPKHNGIKPIFDYVENGIKKEAVSIEQNFTGQIMKVEFLYNTRFFILNNDGELYLMARVSGPVFERAKDLLGYRYNNQCWVGWKLPDTYDRNTFGNVRYFLTKESEKLSRRVTNLIIGA